MSVPLKSILTSVESLVKKIEENKDLILNQLKGKDCVSSAQMSLLLNSFFNQIIDNKEVKPNSELIRQSLGTDPHKVFVDEINKTKLINRELESKLDLLQNKLNYEINQKFHFQKLYEEYLQLISIKEIYFKQQINYFKQKINKYFNLFIHCVLCF
jgi:hypothetical protein